LHFFALTGAVPFCCLLFPVWRKPLEVFHHFNSRLEKKEFLNKNLEGVKKMKAKMDAQKESLKNLKEESVQKQKTHEKELEKQRSSLLKN
jgi:hypothetical protein